MPCPSCNNDRVLWDPDCGEFLFDTYEGSTVGIKFCPFCGLDITNKEMRPTMTGIAGRIQVEQHRANTLRSNMDGLEKVQAEQSSRIAAAQQELVSLQHSIRFLKDIIEGYQKGTLEL